MNLDKYVRPITQRFASAFQNFALESLDVDKQHIRPAELSRQLVHRIRTNSLQSPVALVPHDGPVQSLAELDRSRISGRCSMQNLELCNIVERAITFAEFRVVRIRFERHDLSFGADDSRQHHRNYTLMRSEVEHPRTRLEAAGLEHRNLRKFRPIRVIPSLGEWIREPDRQRKSAVDMRHFPFAIEMNAGPDARKTKHRPQRLRNRSPCDFFYFGHQ